MDEFIGHILKALTVLLVVGVVKLRDMILANRREIVALLKEADDIKRAQSLDRVEQKGLLNLGAALDLKIEHRLNEMIKTISDERHKDSQAFTHALHGLKETLIDMNATLGHMKGDVENLKKKP